MYFCVQCGRMAREGEKRCPECGMRLITPARLNRLLDEAKAEKARSKKNTSNAVRGKVNASTRSMLDAAAITARKAIDGSAKWWTETKPVLVKNKDKLLKKIRRKIRLYKRKLSVLAENANNRLQPNPKATKTANKVKRSPASRKRNISFTEKYLRSMVAMSLLALTLLIILLWGTISAPGMRTFASLGFGNSKGYFLLGNEYLSKANYSRAVESYYTSLNKKNTFEAAYRLAAAYSYTGEMDKCVEMLVYCTENFPGRREPYVKLIQMYPYANTRPTNVAMAIAKGNMQFDLE